MDLIKRMYTRTIKVGLLLLLIPFTAEAGLMRIQFEFFDSGAPTGLGYLQFEDLEIGSWCDINSELMNVDWSFAIADGAGHSFVANSRQLATQASLYGSVRIRVVGVNAFVVDFNPYVTSYTDPDGYTQFGANPAITCRAGLESLVVGDYGAGGPFPISEAWTGAYYTSGIWGDFTTSVWFDDPPPEVPIPASGLLLLSALLPVFGFKRWSRK